MTLVCGSMPAAEDAVQEALARAWERSERGQVIGSLTAWVTTVARNLLRDRFRRLMIERQARRDLAERQGLRSAIGESERRTDVARALAALPRRQREVAVYHYFLDLPLAEIASLLHIPEGSVKSALHRARRGLAGTLADEDESTEVRDGTD
jgi:RNA polymerase sigma-70 factor (ECF subfamily)